MGKKWFFYTKNILYWLIVLSLPSNHGYHPLSAPLNGPEWKLNACCAAVKRVYRSHSAGHRALDFNGAW